MSTVPRILYQLNLIQSNSIQFNSSLEDVLVISVWFNHNTWRNIQTKTTTRTALNIIINMTIHNIFGVLSITFALLALNTNRLLSTMRTSLTDHENDMMKDGTFVSGPLSAVQKAVLFKDFETVFSRKVILAGLYSKLTDWLVWLTIWRCAGLIFSSKLYNRCSMWPRGTQTSNSSDSRRHWRISTNSTQLR